MIITDRSGWRREWYCSKCGLWQTDLDFDLNGKATHTQNPCLQCGSDPWTPTWALRFRWVKK